MTKNLEVNSTYEETLDNGFLTIIRPSDNNPNTRGCYLGLRINQPETIQLFVTEKAKNWNLLN